MASILSFDPGQTTGFALYDTDTKEFALEGIIENGATPHLNFIWNFIEEINPQQVVVESFHLYGGKASAKIGSSFPEIEVIGCIRTWVQVQRQLSGSEEPTLTLQTASQGKSIWTNERLKQFGYYTKNRHSRDAVRHALHFTKRHRELRNDW